VQTLTQEQTNSDELRQAGLKTSVTRTSEFGQTTSSIKSTHFVFSHSASPPLHKLSSLSPSLFPPSLGLLPSWFRTRRRRLMCNI